MVSFVSLFKEPNFGFVDFLYCFSTLSYIYSNRHCFPPASLGLVYFSFYSSLNCKVRLLDVRPLFFYIYNCKCPALALFLLCAINFSMFCLCFQVFPNFLSNSLVFLLLIHWLFKNMLFNLYKFVNFPVFLLLLISNIILYLEKILCMISIF